MAAKLLQFPQRRWDFCSNAHRVKGPEQLEVCAYCSEQLCVHDLSCRCHCPGSQKAAPKTVKYSPPVYRVEENRKIIVFVPLESPSPRRKVDA